MSLPSRFAGSITASFIGRVMRPLGGRSSTSIHFQSHSGSGSIVRPIASTPGRNCKADQRRCRRGRDREAGLLLSVYVPGISGLLSGVCSTRSRSHRPKAAASPRGLPSPTRAAIEANPDREWHLREGEAAMTVPIETSRGWCKSWAQREAAGTDEPTTHTDAAEAPCHRRTTPPHDVDGGVHVSV